MHEMVRMDTVVERDTPTPLITSSDISVLMTLSKPTLTASSAYWNLWKRFPVRKSPGSRCPVRNIRVTDADTRGPETARMMSAQQRDIWRYW